MLEPNPVLAAAAGFSAPGASELRSATAPQQTEARATQPAQPSGGSDLLGALLDEDGLTPVGSGASAPATAETKGPSRFKQWQESRDKKKAAKLANKTQAGVGLGQGQGKETKPGKQLGKEDQEFLQNCFNPETKREVELVYEALTKGAQPTKHTIGTNENYGSIAQRYGVTEDELRKAIRKANGVHDNQLRGYGQSGPTADGGYREVTYSAGLQAKVDMVAGTEIVVPAHRLNNAVLKRVVESKNRLDALWNKLTAKGVQSDPNKASFQEVVQLNRLLEIFSDPGNEDELDFSISPDALARIELQLANLTQPTKQLLGGITLGALVGFGATALTVKVPELQPIVQVGRFLAGTSAMLTGGVASGLLLVSKIPGISQSDVGRWSFLMGNKGVEVRNKLGGAKWGTFIYGFSAGLLGGSVAGGWVNEHVFQPAHFENILEHATVVDVADGVHGPTLAIDTTGDGNPDFFVQPDTSGNAQIFDANHELVFQDKSGELTDEFAKLVAGGVMPPAGEPVPPTGPTIEPTAEPTPKPTDVVPATPEPTATATATPSPTHTGTPSPTAEATHTATPSPTAEATHTAIPEVKWTPTPQATATPEATAEPQPTPYPTPTTTPEPTEAPQEPVVPPEPPAGEEAPVAPTTPPEPGTAPEAPTAPSLNQWEKSQALAEELGLSRPNAVADLIRDTSAIHPDLSVEQQTNLAHMAEDVMSAYADGARFESDSPEQLVVLLNGGTDPTTLTPEQQGVLLSIADGNIEFTDANIIAPVAPTTPPEPGTAPEAPTAPSLNQWEQSQALAEELGLSRPNAVADLIRDTSAIHPDLSVEQQTNLAHMAEDVMSAYADGARFESDSPEQLVVLLNGGTDPTTLTPEQQGVLLSIADGNIEFTDANIIAPVAPTTPPEPGTAPEAPTAPATGTEAPAGSVAETGATTAADVGSGSSDVVAPGTTTEAGVAETAPTTSSVDMETPVKVTDTVWGTMKSVVDDYEVTNGTLGREQGVVDFLKDAHEALKKDSAETFTLQELHNLIEISNTTLVEHLPVTPTEIPEDFNNLTDLQKLVIALNIDNMQIEPGVKIGLTAGELLGGDKLLLEQAASGNINLQSPVYDQMIGENQESALRGLPYGQPKQY